MITFPVNIAEKLLGLSVVFFLLRLRIDRNVRLGIFVRNICEFQLHVFTSRPAQVGCYQLHELLGTGSYAVVHRAHNCESERNGFPFEVAVKLIDDSKVEAHEALPTIDDEVLHRTQASCTGRGHA